MCILKRMDYSPEEFKRLSDNIADNGIDFSVHDGHGSDLIARTADASRLKTVLERVSPSDTVIEIRTYKKKSRMFDRTFFNLGAPGLGSLPIPSVERESAAKELDRAIAGIKKDYEIQRLQDKMETLLADNRQMAAQLAAQSNNGLGGLDLGGLLKEAIPYALPLLMGGAAPAGAPVGALPEPCAHCAELAAKAGGRAAEVRTAAMMMAENPDLLDKFETLI